MQTLQVRHFEKEGLPCKLTIYKVCPGNYGYSIQRQYFKQGKLQDTSYYIDGFTLQETLDKKLKETVKVILRKGFVECHGKAQ